MVQYSTVQCNAEDRRGVRGVECVKTAQHVQHSTYSTVQLQYSTLNTHSTLQHSDVECSIYPHTSPLQTPLSPFLPPFLPPFVSLRPLLSSPLFSSNPLQASPFPSPFYLSPSLPAPLTYFTGDAGIHPLKHRQNTANTRHSPTSPSTTDCSMVVTTDLTIVLTGQYVP
jgi:hypothetical protein